MPELFQRLCSLVRMRRRRWMPLLFVGVGMLVFAGTAQARTWEETTGGVTHTWTDYHNAGGYEGPSIPAYATVAIACRLEGFRVEDGNTWWYQIASAPWSYGYYASADAFYNNGQKSGSLKGTPFYDPAVKVCGTTLPPAASTGGASSVSQTSATLNGSVNPEGEGNITGCEFDYGTSPSYGSSIPCPYLPGNGSSWSGESASISGLTPGTTYYFRIVAYNAGGGVEGGRSSFTTPAPPPVVVTQAGTPTSQTTAVLNATVNPEGTNVTSCQFEYGTTPSLGSSIACEALPGSGTSPVGVLATLEGLSANSTYYFRISATNTGGTSHGAKESLRTPPNAPTIETGEPTALGQTSALVHGTVDPNDGEVSECEFEYGTSEAYGSSLPCSPLPGSGAAPVDVSAQLTGLASGTTYYYRITATNLGGTASSAGSSFQTAVPALPELGRCVLLTQAKGRYKTPTCTIKSTGENTGSYEWQPWPAPADQFTGTSDAVRFETVAKSTIVCASSSITGEYTGSQTLAATAKFTGCEAPGALGGSCQSAGAEAGQIITGNLIGTLGVIRSGSKPTIGWDIGPASGSTIAAFKCGESSLSLVGSVIAPAIKADAMSESFVLKFKQAKGKQKPELLEGAEPDTLRLVTGHGEEQTGLTTTETLTNSELVEIKAIA